MLAIVQTTLNSVHPTLTPHGSSWCTYLQDFTLLSLPLASISHSPTLYILPLSTFTKLFTFALNTADPQSPSPLPPPPSIHLALWPPIKRAHFLPGCHHFIQKYTKRCYVDLFRRGVNHKIKSNKIKKYASKCTILRPIWNFSTWLKFVYTMTGVPLAYWWQISCTTKTSYRVFFFHWPPKKVLSTES